MIRKVITNSLFLISVLICFPCFAAEPAISEKNWVTHPSILEIRSIYNDIIKNIKEENHYIKYSFLNNTLWLDENSTVRSIYSALFWGGGSGGDRSVYYDSKGNLRFCLYRHSLDGDEEVTIDRFYFSKDGEIIYPFSKELRNEGMEILKKYRVAEVYLNNEIRSCETDLIDRFMSISSDVKFLLAKPQQSETVVQITSLLDEIRILNLLEENLQKEHDSILEIKGIIKNIRTIGNGGKKSTNAQHGAPPDANSGRR